MKLSRPRDIALRYAAQNGNFVCAKVLILIGANASAQDENGGTPLFDAAASGKPKVVKLLLDAGSSPTAKDSDGKVPLYYALYSGEAECAKVDTLLINAGGLKPIKYPFWCIHNSLTSSQQITVLLDHGVDPNLVTPDGTTPLMLFAEYGDPSAVSTLVDRGANVNAISVNGDTALGKATVSGNVEVVRYLLGHGADARTTIRGKTLIELARIKRDESTGSPLMIPRYDAIIRQLSRNGTF